MCQMAQATRYLLWNGQPGFDSESQRNGDFSSFLRVQIASMTLSIPYKMNTVALPGVKKVESKATTISLSVNMWTLVSISPVSFHT